MLKIDIEGSEYDVIYLLKLNLPIEQILVGSFIIDFEDGFSKTKEVLGMLKN